MDLLRHAEGTSVGGSGYVGTSRSSSRASGFPDGGPTNVYEVRAPGGTRSPYPSELEIAYPGGVPSSCIVGCTLPSGQWVPNPGYRGPQ
jgi:hypothetical protein